MPWIVNLQLVKMQKDELSKHSLQGVLCRIGRVFGSYPPSMYLYLIINKLYQITQTKI